LLTSLAAEGLVDRQPNGRWILGPEQYVLGMAAARRYDVTATAQESVRRLAELTGDSAFFSVRRGDESICVLGEEGSFPIRVHVLYEGVRFPLAVASAGIAILAFLPDADVDAYLARTDLSPEYGDRLDEDHIREHIRQTRVVGYSVNPGLVVEGSWGMGAAVFDETTGEPRWGLTLAGIEHRFGPDRLPRLGELLLREAHQLGRRIHADLSGAIHAGNG
jgi:DNA-binding IclR family transcriptional regulator